MKRTISVVLLTRDSKFKKYGSHRHDVAGQAIQFSNTLSAQQPDETFCVYEKASGCYVVCRVINENEYQLLTHKADLKKIDVQTILHIVGKKTLDTCLSV